jgi:hypothetical protein
MDPLTIPSFSTRLWSEEVGTADPGADLNAPPALEYKFSSGRRRVDVLADSLYAPQEVP